MIKRILLSAFVLCLLIFGAILPVKAVTTQEYKLAAVTPENTVFSPNDALSAGILSADGRYVLFGNTSMGKVFLRDLEQESTTVIASDAPARVLVGGISQDGRYVAYGKENPTIQDPGRFPTNHLDGFLLDRQTGQNYLLDEALGGGSANKSGFDNASISDNGNFVVFRSNATNLVADTTTSCTYYIRDISAGTTDCAVRDDSGLPVKVQFARLSGDGQHIVFEVDNPFLGYTLLVRDLQTNTYKGVRQAAVGLADAASISQDGRYVGYLTIISGNAQAVRFDTQTDTSAVGSVNSSAQNGDNYSFTPRISADGRYLAFRSYATNLLDGADTTHDEVYLHDFVSNATTRVASSGDGAIANGVSAEPSISADGSVVVFSTFATDLNPLSGLRHQSGSSIYILTRTEQPDPTPTPVSILLSGHVTQDGVTPIENVRVRTITVGNFITTDSDGFYSFAAPAENTSILFANNAPNTNAPYSSLPNNWTLQIGGLDLSEDTTFDVQIPTKTLLVHVEDPNGSAIANAFVQVFFPNGSANVPVVSTNGVVTGSFGYSQNTSNATFFGYTDNNGDLNGIVISPADYRIAADPPSGNSTLLSASEDKFISSNTSQTIVLPFIITPTPTSTPTPFPTATPIPTNTPTPTPTVTPTPVVRQLTSLSPARVWMGKAIGDAGLKLDVLAEVYKGSILVSSGQTNSVTVGSGIFALADLITVPFNSFSPTAFPTGTQLKIKVSARNACTGSLRNQGTARLWFNDTQANSSFDATIATGNHDYYLRSGSVLSTTVGTGPRQNIDVQAGAKCSAFKPFGTWTITP